MARAIDANELMVEIQVCSWDSEQDKERAEDLVLGMPTLTPPPVGADEENNERMELWLSHQNIPAAQKSGIFRSHAIRRRNCKMNKCSLFDMTFSEIIEDIFGVSFDRLWELALADRERRCVVMPCQPGYKISYKSSTGFWCNAVIKDYTPENIFITAETEIPNAEPLSHTFSILEIEAALRREKE